MVKPELPHDVEVALKINEDLVNGRLPLTNYHFYLFGYNVMSIRWGEKRGIRLPLNAESDLGEGVVLNHGVSTRIRGGFSIVYHTLLGPIHRQTEVHGRLDSPPSFRTYLAVWTTEGERREQLAHPGAPYAPITRDYKLGIIRQVWDTFMAL